VGTTSYDFYIYAHEASRPDADTASAGTMSHRSCSKAGALPWAMVSYAEADAACKAAGMRLCTGAEWTVACQGATPTLYPYGDTYQPQTCNGVDSPAGGQPVPTGSLSSCEGGETGLFDMSGNLREWTSQSTGTTSGPNPKTVYVVRGGAYHTPSMGLSCTFSLSQAVEDVVLPAIGFRCCLDGP
jgi:formylglycine-generating enzyme required for sulfatase activity